MSVETFPGAAVLPEVQSQISLLQQQIVQLQQELSQAQEVWRATLEAEKSQFEDLRQHKELAWKEQEEQWQRQRAAYEERIETLESDLKARLEQAEHNGLRALRELDDAWQRDKLEWGPPARAEWVSLKPALESRIQELEAQLKASEDARQADRQAALDARAPIEAMRDQLTQFQTRMEAMQSGAERDALIQASLETLDSQIQVLYDLVQLFTSDTPLNPAAMPAPSLDVQ